MGQTREQRYKKKVNMRDVDIPDCCACCDFIDLGYEGDVDCGKVQEFNDEKREKDPEAIGIIVSIDRFCICDEFKKFKPEVEK